MATGSIWLKVPATLKVRFEGDRMPWVGGKDLILYLLGQIGVEGANYCAIEFGGSAIKSLSMDQRLTMANMAVEGGAKNGIFEPDDITKMYMANRTKRKPTYYKSDPDAGYQQEIVINSEQIIPQVAFPHSPDNVRPVTDATDIQPDQVFIGSCTNGRMEDLRQAAEVIKGKKIAKGLRMIVIPGSQQIYKQAIQEGIIETFIDSGATIGPPSCGPCLGGHLGILADGEKCVSTSNRNFVGRMGHPESEVYLTNPAIAAATAVLGRIGTPGDF